MGVVGHQHGDEGAVGWQCPFAPGFEKVAVDPVLGRVAGQEQLRYQAELVELVAETGDDDFLRLGLDLVGLVDRAAGVLGRTETIVVRVGGVVGQVFQEDDRAVEEGDRRFLLIVGVVLVGLEEPVGQYLKKGEEGRLLQRLENGAA